MTVAYAPLSSWWDVNGNRINSDETLVTFDSAQIVLVLPYSNKAKTLKVYDVNDNLLVEKDLSHLSPIKYSIGFGGNDLKEDDLNVSYILTPQPVKKLIGVDKNILLGDLTFLK